MLRFYILERGDDPATSQIAPESFDDPTYQHVWRSIQAGGEWAATDWLSADQIKQIYTDSGEAKDRETHIRRLAKKGAVRRAVAEAQAAISRFRDTVAIDEFAGALGDAAAVALGGTGGVEVQRLGDVVFRIGEEYLRGQPPRLERIPVPWPTVQSRNGGLPTRRLHLIGAVTSGRKTTMAKMIALEAARKGHEVLIWSLEDDNDSVGERSLAEEMGGCHELGRIVRRDPVKPMPAEDAARGFQAIDRLHGYGSRIGLVDRSGVTARFICSEIRRMSPLPKVVIIDFLQLLVSDTPTDADHVHMAKAAKMFQAFAKEIDSAVILVTQLNQDQARRGGAPKLGDIRGGAAIAQAAHAVIMGEPHVDDSGQSLAGYTIHIRKWKDGNKFSLQCTTLPNQDRIVEIDTRG